MKQLRGFVMNWDQIEGRWKEFKGKAVEKWGDITDDDWDRMAGKRDQMIGYVQKKFGDDRAKAEKEVDAWTRGL
jgi:uncharacterized protein YjbJ (UPF0337 family)